MIQTTFQISNFAASLRPHPSSQYFKPKKCTQYTIYIYMLIRIANYFLLSENYDITQWIVNQPVVIYLAMVC